MRYLGLVRHAIATVAVVGVGLGAAKAATITEPFSLTVSPPVPFPTTAFATLAFPVTPFAQFNPAEGTLNDFSATLNGPATWNSSSSSPLLNADLVLHNSFELVDTAIQDFIFPGDITVDLHGTKSFTPSFASLVGVGTATLDLRLLGHPGDTFATSGLTGSITYDFKPIPEPLTWAMMLIGLGGLGFLGYRQTGRTKPRAA